MKFAGPDYSLALDHARLKTQIDRIRVFMLNRGWLTLNDISKAVDAPTSSVSSQLSNLRAEENGGYIVERKRVDGGLWAYQLTSPPHDVAYLAAQVVRRREILAEMEARLTKAQRELMAAIDKHKAAEDEEGRRLKEQMSCQGNLFEGVNG